MKDWSEKFNSLSLQEKKAQFQFLLQEMEQLCRTECWTIGFDTIVGWRLRVIDWADEKSAEFENYGPGLWVEINELRSWIENIK